MKQKSVILLLFTTYFFITAVIHTRVNAVPISNWSDDYDNAIAVIVIGDFRGNRHIENDKYNSDELQELLEVFYNNGRYMAHTMRSVMKLPRKNIRLTANMDSDTRLWIRKNGGKNTLLLLYMVGHGVKTKNGEQYAILHGDGYYTVERMSKDVGFLQDGGAFGDAVIIVDSCYSGAFLEPLSADNRLVITASGKGEFERWDTFRLFGRDDTLSIFTGQFIYEAVQAGTFEEAFTNAKKKIERSEVQREGSLHPEMSNGIAEGETEVRNSKRAVYYGDFGVTVERVKDSSNWGNKVEKLFGDQYRVADWNDLVAYHKNGGDILQLFNRLGIKGSAYVTRNGDPSHSSRRFYFASLHNHKKPGNYLAHDNIDNYLVSLGSWHGSCPVLVVKRSFKP